MTDLVTARRLERLRSTLSDRDWQIITMLARVRVATTSQLEAVCFADVSRRRAQQRLTALTQQRIVGRLPRVIGGVRAGSRGHVYALDAAGQRLADLARSGRPRRPGPVGRTHLDHALTVTQTYVQAVQADRIGQLHLRRFTGEPGAWRTFYGAGGARLTLAPDAYLITAVDGYEDHWFLEIDLNTESAATLTRKLGVYRAYWQSGNEQAAHNIFPKVLWVVPDEMRAETLRQVIDRQPAPARSLFAVAQLDEFVTRLREGAE
jgi:hypothetical protein